MGENTEEAHATKGYIQEVKIEETSIKLEPENPGEENEYQRNVCETIKTKKQKI